MERRDIVKNVPLILTSAAALGYQANSTVRFGIIGTGGRGQYVGSLMAKDANARVTAICDPYPDRIDGAKTKVPGADKAAVPRDYRKLLADPSVSSRSKEESKADITGEATAAFFKGILAGESYDMTRTAVEGTLSAILGRMAIQTKREVGWDEMMRSA